MIRLGRFLGLGGCLIAIALAGGIWWAGNEIASPARRQLQDYHTDFLADPAAHGSGVKAFTISDGTPCLLLEPLPTGQLGPRGTRLREQLAAENVALPPSGEIIGTLVLIHGRKGRKEDYLLIGERLCAAGFRCLLPDMPAHGDHPAHVVTFGIREGDLPAKVLQEASILFQFSPQPAGLLGISMGGAVAIHSAALQDAPWKTLVVISSFDRLDRAIETNVAARVGSSLGHLWQRGAGWVYQARTGIPLRNIRSDLRAEELRIPVFVAHGTTDGVIPLESGRRLFDAVPASLEKQWVEVPDADHHNVLITDFPIYATVAHWMLRHVRVAAPEKVP